MLQITLAGCMKVTEDGVMPLVQNCKSLRSIDLTGTSVAILPRGLAEYKAVEVGGCPLLSPGTEVLQKHGLKMLAGRVYRYWQGNNTVLCCHPVLKSYKNTDSKCWQVGCIDTGRGIIQFSGVTRY